MALVEHAVAVPKRGQAATPAGWSLKEEFRDVRPTGTFTRLGDLSGRE